MKFSSYRGRSPKWSGKVESKLEGNLNQNGEEVVPDFNSKFGGIEATERRYGLYWLSVNDDDDVCKLYHSILLV